MLKLKTVIARTLAVIILMMIVTIYVNVNSTSAATIDKMKAGVYVQFGEYQGKPLLWQVIGTDEEGNPMLWSQSVISAKMLSGISPQFDYSSGNYQSFYWKGSNLRQWLNSGEKRISWISDAPSVENTYMEFEYNYAYEGEAGFLTGFSKSETAMIKPTKRKIPIQEDFKESPEGGTEWYTGTSSEDINIEEAVSNFDKSYYITTTDKIFFLNVKELRQAKKSGFSLRKERSKVYKNYPVEWETYAPYWIETPGNFVTMFMTKDGKVSSDNGYKYINSISGVCPATVLDKSKILIKSGRGEENSPFILTLADGSVKDEIESKDTLQIGDYINLGKYANNNILWRVVNINNDGSYILLSERILDFVPFDLGGHDTDYTNDGKTDTDDVLRRYYGSNYWTKSDIREWLNRYSNKNYSGFSYEEKIKVRPHYVYEAELFYSPTFLYGFSSNERGLIIPYKHNVAISIFDWQANDKEFDEYSAKLYESVTDYVFLLNSEEIKKYVINRSWSAKKYPTDYAMKNGFPTPTNYIDKVTKNPEKYNWSYWKLDPKVNTSYKFSDILVYDVNAKEDSLVGVAPALCITDSLKIVTGNGTAKNPYTVQNAGKQSYTISSDELNLQKSHFDTDANKVVNLKDKELVRLIKDNLKTKYGINVSGSLMRKHIKMIINLVGSKQYKINMNLFKEDITQLTNLRTTSYSLTNYRNIKLPYALFSFSWKKGDNADNINYYFKQGVFFEYYDRDGFYDAVIGGDLSQYIAMKAKTSEVDNFCGLMYYNGRLPSKYINKEIVIKNKTDKKVIAYSITSKTESKLTYGMLSYKSIDLSKNVYKKLGITETERVKSIKRILSTELCLYAVILDKTDDLYDFIKEGIITPQSTSIVKVPNTNYSLYAFERNYMNMDMISRIQIEIGSSASHDMRSLILRRKNELKQFKCLLDYIKSISDNPALQIKYITGIAYYKYDSFVSDIRDYQEELNLSNSNSHVKQLKLNAKSYAIDNLIYLLKLNDVQVVGKDSDSVTISVDGAKIVCNPFTAKVDFSNMSLEDQEEVAEVEYFMDDIFAVTLNLIYNTEWQTAATDEFFYYFYPNEDPGFKPRLTLDQAIEYMHSKLDEKVSFQ